MPPPAGHVATSVAGGDWLASVCPYLASEDGAYRSAAPEGSHRCIAVDPPATLPLAFQERFCLTDRHPRCEMYKFAQEGGSDGGIPVPAGELQAAAATRPNSPTGSGGSSSRTIVGAALGIGGVAILVLILVLAMGSCTGEPAGPPDDQATAEPQPTEAPRRTPAPTPRPTPTPTSESAATAEPDGDATPGASASSQGPGMVILYEVQEGEALLKIAETFEVTRRRLLRGNPGLEDVPPAELPGRVIQIPVPEGMTIEEVEALPGYRGLAE